jgi:opacity protein-like surface antigen
VCLFIFSAAALAQQPFSAGVKVGVPLTDFINTVQSQNFVYNSSTNRYIVGAMAELRLPFGLGVEFDALYRRLHYNGSGTLTNILVSSQTTGNAWEFPLLLKYRIPGKIVRPYVEAGAAWDTLSGLKSDISRFSGQVLSSSGSPAELKNSTTTGFVIGAGLDVHAILLHVSPEIRFTRWGSKHFADVNGLLRSNQNQGEFLLGITF